MILVSIDMLIIIISIIIFIMNGVGVLFVALLVIDVILTLCVLIHRRSIKKYNMELVKKFQNKLEIQVNNTISRRVATEIQMAESVRNDKRIALDKKEMEEENQGFDINTSIVNGGDILVELRLLSGRYANETIKDKCSEYII